MPSAGFEPATPAIKRPKTYALDNSVTMIGTQNNTIYKHKRQTSIPSAGFEPSTPATKRPQTYASDRAATWIDELSSLYQHNQYVTKRRKMNTRVF
jgi:hypothetical protein